MIVYEYDQSKMEGPPFSIDDAEIKRLYGKAFSIRLAECEKPQNEGPRLAAVESMRQKVYILKKTDSLR